MDSEGEAGRGEGILEIEMQQCCMKIARRGWVSMGKESIGNCHKGAEVALAEEESASTVVVAVAIPWRLASLTTAFSC